jgi:hypothetical protein
MGRELAKLHPVDADLVIGVPDSGISHATGYSEESGIPYGEGLVKNRYVNRTFIEPDQALRDLGVEKVGFCSPYTRRLNAEGAVFLNQAGFEVVNQAYVGDDLGNYGQGALNPEEVFRLGVEADRADAQAVVLSCTDMRSVETIDALEETLRKPVVTSNQALMYVARKRLELADEENPVPGALGGFLPAAAHDGS